MKFGLSELFEWRRRRHLAREHHDENPEPRSHRPPPEFTYVEAFAPAEEGSPWLSVNARFDSIFDLFDPWKSVSQYIRDLRSSITEHYSWQTDEGFERWKKTHRGHELKWWKLVDPECEIDWYVTSFEGAGTLSVQDANRELPEDHVQYEDIWINYHDIHLMFQGYFKPMVGEWVEVAETIGGEFVEVPKFAKGGVVK